MCERVTLVRVETIFDDRTPHRRNSNGIRYLRSKAQHWRLESLRRNDGMPSQCLALAEQFDARADAAAACHAEREALEMALNMLTTLANNDAAELTDGDRAHRIARALVRMDDLLRELDGLDLRLAATYLSMALDTARAGLPPCNG
jgi:hypothetical protein